MSYCGRRFSGTQPLPSCLRRPSTHFLSALARASVGILSGGGGSTDPLIVARGSSGPLGRKSGWSCGGDCSAAIALSANAVVSPRFPILTPVQLYLYTQSGPQPPSSH